MCMGCGQCFIDVFAFRACYDAFFSELWCFPSFLCIDVLHCVPAMVLSYVGCGACYFFCIDFLHYVTAMVLF